MLLGAQRAGLLLQSTHATAAGGRWPPQALLCMTKNTARAMSSRGRRAFSSAAPELLFWPSYAEATFLGLAPVGSPPCGGQRRKE